MNSKKIIVAVSLIVFAAGTMQAERYKYENARKGNDAPPGTAANCTPATAATELNINNVKALIQSGGDMWWDFNRSRYEIPQGSEKTSLFAGSLWLAGQDVSGQFKVAALRFRQVGNDYWTGPLSTVDAEINPATCKDYDRHYETTRSMVSEFAGWYAAGVADSEDATNTQEELYPGYLTPSVITDWPAHGRNFEPYNEDYYLAPFFDYNGDGDYNPTDGDYPGYVLSGKSDCSRRVRDIYGDQNIWWVFNDKGNIHSESGGQSIGMEIRAQAFAFATTDEVNNMTFYNYELINRSTFNLTDTYFGQWADGDLGNAQDDFVGCDVRRGLGYFYNGDDEDQDAGGNIGYGSNPPAVGIDFFQGPFQANDNRDNCLCVNDIAAAQAEDGIVYSGQGAGYGDGIVDNERYGMRKFLYHNNQPGPTGDPNIATDYYNMLRGVWRDGTPMTFGGNGYDPSNANAIPANYMFPGDTDPLNWGTEGVNPGVGAWTEVSAGNPPGDRRFVQSSGPFELGPGAVNNITVGVAWMQASSGGRLQSVEDMRKADDKTQALFDSCFEILDGPNAPDVTIQELDREVILMLSNPLNSNNYQEAYATVDPFLPAPDSVDTDDDGSTDTPLTAAEKEAYSTYVFEGYQIYQLADGSVGTNDLTDPDKARLIAQVDIANGVERLINYEYDSQIDADVPSLKVDGLNEGIEHSFQFTEDVFSTGDARLVNHKTYYYMAVAYAYNRYGDGIGNLSHIDGVYDPSSDPPRLDGQKLPYLASRTSANGPVKVFEAIPHRIDLEMDGVELNSEYGDGVELTRVEGRGNGGNYAIIKEDYLDEAQDSKYLEEPVYEAGFGPVAIKVVDPLVIPPGTFTLAFKDTTSDHNLENMIWELSGENITTVTSDQAITLLNEQVIFDLGLSVSVSYGYPAPTYPSDGNASANAGFIGFDIQYEDETDQWLAGLVDVDADARYNWIKSGTFLQPAVLGGAKDWAQDDHYDNYEANDPTDNDSPLDEEQVWENIGGRTWSPFALASYDTAHPIPLFNLSGVPSYNFSEKVIELAGMANTPSVDVIITTDCSKWTRCPVLEAGDNSGLTKGGAVRGELRRGLSVDKSGRNQLDAGFVAAEGFGTEVSGSPQVLGSDRAALLRQSDKDHLIALGFKEAEFKDVSFGMGWFPGYAVDVETGERLNMAFSEDSWLGKENGADMKWNPTDRIAEPLFGELRFGGKQMIYIFRHNTEDGATIDDQYLMPGYNGDGGTFAYDKLVSFDSKENLHVIDQNSNQYKNYMSVMRAGAWVGYPLLADGGTLFGNGYVSSDDCDGDEAGNDITISLRATKQYRPYAVGEGIDLPGPKLSVGTGYYVQSGKVNVIQTDEAGVEVLTTFGAGEAFTAEEQGYTLGGAAANVIATVNGGLPLYTFNTDALAPTINTEIGTEMLEEIKAVPNPYYAYSEYETGRLEYLMKVINLPTTCTINIFTVNGILVRSFEKDDATTSSIDWDLKNQDGIPIASGLYIIHVNAPGLGEKVIKWFGVLRPIDLNSF
jgi:hypothetical protein